MNANFSSRKKVKRLGAMADRREETATSYMRTLLKAGLTTKDTMAPTAWSVWLRVNEDPVILQKKTRLPKIHQRTASSAHMQKQPQS